MLQFEKLKPTSLDVKHQPSEDPKQSIKLFWTHRLRDPQEPDNN